ncbi:MAG: hypothetical protein ABI626_03440 [Sphingomicrobium sp.]
MDKNRARAWAGLCLLLLAGCGSRQGEADETATAKLPPAVKSPDQPADGMAEVANPPTAGEAGTPPSRLPESSRYTSVDPGSCKLLEQNVEEGGYWRRRCAGPAGFALETSESDLRQDIVIIAPDGRRSQLKLSSLVAKGAFNSLGKVAEWRGLKPDSPHALIVRLSVAAGSARPDRSDLVVVRLAPPACVVAVVEQGPDQNQKARAIADSDRPACKAGP